MCCLFLGREQKGILKFWRVAFANRPDRIIKAGTWSNQRERRMWRACENSQPSFGHNIACTRFMDVFWLLLLSQMTDSSANFTCSMGDLQSRQTIHSQCFQILPQVFVFNWCAHRWGASLLDLMSQWLMCVCRLCDSPWSCRCGPAESRSADLPPAARWLWPPLPESAAGRAGPLSSAAPGGAPRLAPPDSASRPCDLSGAPTAPSPRPSACGWPGPDLGPSPLGWGLGEVRWEDRWV